VAGSMMMLHPIREPRKTLAGPQADKEAAVTSNLRT